MSQVSFSATTTTTTTNHGGCNSSSSYFFYGGGTDWNISDSFSNSELGIVGADPAEIFEGYFELPRSISHDIQKIESDTTWSSLCLNELSEDYLDCDIKPEIRNMDCMWSGHSALTAIFNNNNGNSISTLSSSSSISSSSTIATTNTKNFINNPDTDPDIDLETKCDGITVGDFKVTTALPLSMVTGGSTADINSIDIDDNKLKKLDMINLKIKSEQNDDSFPYYDLSATIKVESEDDGYKINAEDISKRKLKQQQNIQNIPAGTSLLRRTVHSQIKSNSISPNKSQKQNQFTNKNSMKRTQKLTNSVAGTATNKMNKTITKTIPIPNVTASEFIRDREMCLSSTAAASSSFSSTTSKSASTFLNNNNNSTRGKTVNGGGNIRTKSSNSSGGGSIFGRPDTPLSLDDDATEFKHSVDLRACVMGSNNISLVSGNESIDNDPAILIKDLREQLEDMTKNQIDIRRIHSYSDDAEIRSYADVIAAINGHEQHLNPSPSSPSSLIQSPQTNYKTWDTTDDDEDDDDDEDECDDDDYNAEYGISTHSENNQSSQYPIMHSDHSYTRSKDGINDMSPNLDTPSDSDEEIDVVSVGDKKLPTNPSAKDRRAIQTKVAYKFSNSRIVKTPNGIRTILPRRHESCELLYTSARINPNKNGSSTTTSSRYQSNSSKQQQYSKSGTAKILSSSSTKLIGGSQLNRTNGIRSMSSSSSSTVSLLIPPTASTKSVGNNGNIHQQNQRKNLLSSGVSKRNLDDADEYVPPSKRYRVKKQKQNVTQSQQQQHQTQQQQLHYQQQRNTISVGNHHRHPASTFNSKFSSKQQQQNHHQYQQQQQQQQQQHHQHQQQQQHNRLSNSVNDETMDTIEKRNLHNDMERQRRIGLKNLFEGLKAQIPSLQDKERAPKVNILREAAKLCEQLVRQDQQLIEQKTKLQEEFIRRQEYLNLLRTTTMPIMN